MKRRLLKYHAMELEVQQLKEQIYTLKDRVTSIKSSSDISGIPGGSGTTDKVGELVSKILDLQNQYYEKTLCLVEELRWIEGVINTLEDSHERLLMRSYYIEGKTWEETAVAISFTYRHTLRLHGNILEKLKSKAA